MSCHLRYPGFLTLGLCLALGMNSEVKAESNSVDDALRAVQEKLKHVSETQSQPAPAPVPVTTPTPAAIPVEHPSKKAKKPKKKQAQAARTAAAQTSAPIPAAPTENRPSSKMQEVAPPSRPSATRESQETPPIPPSPQEVETRLTKNWGGARKKLSDLGVDIAMIYKGNYEANLSGGKETGSTYLGNFDFRTSIDGEKLVGWKGSSFFVYVLGDHGGHPSADLVGDAQGTSNVETKANYSVKLYEAWFQQLFAEDRISLLAGLHDLNSEFYVTETSGVFLNGSFGTGPELAQTGVNGASVFPFTSPALRLRIEPSKSFYLQTAVFGAKAGDPKDPRGTHASLSANDGFLLISEFAYLRGKEDTKLLYSKYGVGAWTYTSLFDHLVDVTSNGAPAKATTSGAYFLAEQTIWDGVALFLRYGLASSAASRFSSSMQTGIGISGIISNQSTDRLGIGFTQATNGSEYMQLQEADGAAVAETESTLELTYHVDLVPGVAVQPDFQYVMNPNTDPTLKSASVATLRFELNL